MFFDVLHQFQVSPIVVSPNVCGFQSVLTNEVVILLCLLFISLYGYIALNCNNKGFSLLPNNWQALLELIYKLPLSLVLENIKSKEAQKFFPIVFSVFTGVLFLNLIGLLPYSYTLTSQLIITFLLSFSVFIGINILAIKKHGLKFFGLFLPGGTSVPLSFLLVPIEIVSYLFKPISLGTRLFANMMAGHTLLKVIAGFCATMTGTGSFYLFILQYIPLFIMVPLFALEFGVAAIQAFVFAVLTCIYIQDSLYATH
jgi:ATP synthase subunit 6